MDWLDLLAVQGTLKSLLQHHSSNASILWHSAFLTVQLSHPYMTTAKTLALTRQTFVGKVMSLAFQYSILPILPVPLSLTKLPIRIPSAINNIETIIEISIVNIIFIRSEEHTSELQSR